MMKQIDGDQSDVGASGDLENFIVYDYFSQNAKNV